MRGTSHARLLSTRAPVTSVVDQSSSAMHQSNAQSTRISRLEQSGGCVGSPIIQGQNNAHQRLNGPAHQVLGLKDIKPRSFQIEFSPTSKRPEMAMTPKTPVLFTVNGNRSRVSSSTSHNKSREINGPQHDGILSSVNNINKSKDNAINPVFPSGYQSRSSSSNSKGYPLRRGSAGTGDHNTPNFASTPHSLNAGHRDLDSTYQRIISDVISPIHHRMDRSTQPNDENGGTLRLDKGAARSEHHLPSQKFQVQASGRAMEFIVSHEKAPHNPAVGGSSQKANRSTSASRPQYSKPNHPAFLKEVDMALHKLQANTIYSSTIDMLSNNDINHFYAAPPAHFKLMQKKWRASEPPSLPPPPSSDDALPDGIPVLTANPHELKDQCITNRRPVQPIPSSSVGFFIEPDPQVSKKKYSLRRVNSAGASSTIAQKYSNSYVNLRELKQRNLRLTRSSGSEALVTSDRPCILDDQYTLHRSALLTPDISMQADTATDAVTTPVENTKNDRLTIDELRQPLPTKKQVKGAIGVDDRERHAIRSSKGFSRPQSAGECSASQEDHCNSTDKPLLNVRSIIDNRQRLRPPLSSRSSYSKRSHSAQPSRSIDTQSASQSKGSSHAASSMMTRKRSIGYPHTSLSGELDASSITNASSHQTANNSMRKRRPLSSGDAPCSSSVYKTIYGEKPIARGFSTRSTRFLHNSMHSTIDSTNSSLRPGVSLTPYHSLSASKALAVSAVIPTSSLALSMASSYIQSQARSKYNMALMRLQAPSVTLESTPSQRSRTRAASTSTRHSRRTVGIQPRSTTDQSINTVPQTASIESACFYTHSMASKGPSYFTRSRNAKIGTIELKDAYTETGSYRSNTEVSDTRSSLDHPVSSGQQRNVQVLDESLGHRTQSSSFRKAARTTRSAHTRSQSSSSMKAADRHGAAKDSFIKRSHSATFHFHDSKAAFAPTYSISTTDMLAARRLIQPQTNPRFTDHKHDVVTRHLADIAAIPLHPREARPPVEKPNRQASPNIAEALQGLDIPTINSAESSVVCDNRTFSDDQMANTSAYDPNISRNKSAVDTFSSMHTLPSTELDGKNLPIHPQSSEFIQLLDTNTFPNSSTTLEMYIGGLNYQEIDLQHHLFSRRNAVTTSSEPSKGEKEVVKKKVARKARSSSVTASSSAAYIAKGRRSSSSSYSSSKLAQPVSNSVGNAITHILEPQVSLDIHENTQIHSSSKEDMVLGDLDTDGMDTDSIVNSAVCTSNYRETVLLRRRAPDGRTRLAMVSTGDILYESDGTRTAQTLPVQPTQRSLSASAHKAPHHWHSKIHSAKKASAMFNYPSITGKFPLYTNGDDEDAQPCVLLQIDNKDSPPKNDDQRVSKSLPLNKRPRHLEGSGSATIQRGCLPGTHKPLSVSVSAAMARRAYEKQANNENLNMVMHQTAASDISGLKWSPTVSIPRDLSNISQRQSVDKELNLAKDHDKDTIYQSPIIFTSLVDASPPFPSSLGNTVERNTDASNQNVPRSSQPLLRNRASVDDPRKDSAYRARSNRLMESEKDIRSSVLFDTQHSSRVERPGIKIEERVTSHTRQYGRSQVRPLSSSNLSGSMTAMRASRCRTSYAARSVSSAGRESKVRA